MASAFSTPSLLSTSGNFGSVPEGNEWCHHQTESTWMIKTWILVNVPMKTFPSWATGWHGSIVVGRRTCDWKVADLNPGSNRRCTATLDKLFTPHCLGSESSAWWSWTGLPRRQGRLTTTYKPLVQLCSYWSSMLKVSQPPGESFSVSSQKRTLHTPTTAACDSAHETTVSKLDL